MRRYLLSLLCLCLLLSGCGVREPGITTAPPTQVTEPTESADLSAPPADVEVKTDYTHYAPRERLSPLYTVAEELAYDLQPSDGYGMIFPYVGSTAETSYGGSRNIYGIADAAGRLVTAPVYSSVSLLGSWNSYLGGADVTLPLWQLGKIQVEMDGDYDVYQNLYAIASLDGSWVTECCYSHISVLDDCVLAAEINWTEDFCRFDLYSYSGQHLLASEELEILEQIPEPISYVSYGDGMLRLECYGDTDSSTWYTDLQGSYLLGPYCYGDDFSEGLAAVTDDYDRYYYIDTQGRSRFQRRFTSAEPFNDGVAVVSEDWQMELMDSNGNILLKTEDHQSLYRELELFVLADQGICNFYNAQGELVYADFPQDWTYVGRGLFSDWAEEVIHGETQRRFTVTRDPGAYHYARALWNRGIDVLAVSDYTDGTTESYLLDMEANLLMESSGEFFVLQAPDRSVLVEQIGSECRIYDEDLQLLFTCSVDAQPSMLLGDRILCFSERYSLAYSLEGELLFCYPLPSFGGD